MQSFTTSHVDYPHEPGTLYDCTACEHGPCQCTDTDAGCVSVDCTRTADTDGTDTEPRLFYCGDDRRHTVLDFSGDTVTTACGTGRVGLLTDPVRSGDLVMVWSPRTGWYAFTDTVAEVGTDTVRLTGDTEHTPRRNVVRVYPHTRTAPAWFAQWHGGSSYAPSMPDDRIETFASLADARAEFSHRYHSGRGTFRWIEGNPVSRIDTPAVDEQCSMWLWRTDPRLLSDLYPDRVLTIGPRGGVRVEVA